MTTQTTKIYNSFSDKFGNSYTFTNYISFASFWFSLSRKTAKVYFADQFLGLQKAAANSVEAKTKLSFNNVCS